MSYICEKVYVLNLKLVTKLVTTYLTTGPLAKIKMTLKLLLKTLTYIWKIWCKGTGA